MKYLSFLVLLLVVLVACKNHKGETTLTPEISSETPPAEKDTLHHAQPQWAKNAVIYEVNVRQFSPEGTFAKVTEQLDRLKSMGIDVLWLMPIHPIGEKNRKGTMGSYYAVKDYKAVNPEFGTLEDLKSLVDSAHSRDMKVILDWVANHSSPDNHWVKDHLDFYTKDSLGNAPIPTVGTDWIDVADLNYDNPKMREAMMDAMMYWVKEADIDGYRCDVAEMVPMDFWTTVRPKLDSIKPVFMLAEGADPELHEAFNMTYGWPFKDLMVEISEGKKDFSDVVTYLDNRDTEFQPDDLIMYFTTNHDENSWNYLEHEQFGNNHQNYMVLTIAMGGMPLVYSGQESGLDKQLEFFEKDTIEWKDYPKAPFYQKLFEIYKSHPALWNDAPRADVEIIKADKDNFQLIKQKADQMVAFLQNYSDKPQYVSKTSLIGLNTEKNLLSDAAVQVSDKGIEIPPHSTLIFAE